MSLSQVAREVGVSLRDGRWTPAAVAQARIVARLRERGHSLQELREAARSGRLAYGYKEDIFLQHFIEQDVVGHLEQETELGRLRVGIAFADLAGDTRLTEEAGEQEAVDFVERSVAAVQDTLRVVKTIGDEVMVVGSDTGALADWAVGLQPLQSERPLPRTGIHAGAALYRDGDDYHGHAVNLAARVGARAAGGEVLVTRPVTEAAGIHLDFRRIGEVRMKGVSESTELFLASAP